MRHTWGVLPLVLVGCAPGIAISEAPPDDGALDDGSEDDGYADDEDPSDDDGEPDEGPPDEGPPDEGPPDEDPPDDEVPPAPGYDAVSVFSNLKVSLDRAAIYASGDAAAIEAARRDDTLLTFEARSGGMCSPVAVNVLPTGSPGWLPGATLDLGGLWSATGYALSLGAAGTWSAWVRPHALVPDGETFALALGYPDGTMTTQVTSVHEVFVDVPDLVAYGPKTSMHAPGAEPLPFDAGQDLVLEFDPPRGPVGLPIYGLDYQVEVRFLDGAKNEIHAIDAHATWGAPPSGFDTFTQAFHFPNGTLWMSPEETFEVVLPQELFVTSVVANGGVVPVTEYQIDIMAHRDADNAAVIFHLKPD